MIKKKQKQWLQIEAEKELNKQLEKASEKGTGWLRDASQLATRPGEDVSNTFTLPSHVDMNYTQMQSAEKIVNLLSQISQEFTHLEEKKFGRKELRRD